MKRDMETIRKLLIEIEESEVQYSLNSSRSEQDRYHGMLLIDAGLVEGSLRKTLGNTSAAPSIVIIKGLTWDGHEFLDNIRQSEVWETIKSDFKDSSISTIRSVVKQLAEAYAKKKVEALLKPSSDQEQAPMSEEPRD